MLGLADRARVIDLFEAVMRGDAAAALAELRDQYDAGADPAVMLIDLADFVHFVTRIKLVPAVADDPSFAEVERKRGRALAASLSLRVLSRVWQMLLKGIEETQAAAKPLAAAEMVLVRLAYAADLPAPEDVIRRLASGEPAAGESAPRPTTGGGSPAPRAIDTRRSAGPSALAVRSEPSAISQSNDRPDARSEAAIRPVLTLSRFEDLVALAVEKRDLTTKAALERDIRLVRFEDGTLEFALEAGASRAIVGELARKMSDWTGRRWMVALSTQTGAEPLAKQAASEREEFNRGLQADPLVRSVLERFPGAQIVRVTPRGALPDANIIEADEFALPEPDPDEDL
jgi:DNA polymerase-3 subunit gamma/tau